MASAIGEFRILVFAAAFFTLLATMMGSSTLRWNQNPQVLARQPPRLVAARRRSYSRSARRARRPDKAVFRCLALAFVVWGKARILPQFGYSAQYPGYGLAINVLEGSGQLVAGWIGASMGALEVALMTILVFVVFRLLLRGTWLSISAGVLLMSLASVNQMGGAGTVLVWFFPVIRGAILTFVVVRFGLLSLAVALYFSSAMTSIPFRLDLSHWAAMPSTWTLALLMALTLFGFYASRAGQPLFGQVLKD